MTAPVGITAHECDRVASAPVLPRCHALFQHNKEGPMPSQYHLSLYHTSRVTMHVYARIFQLIGKIPSSQVKRGMIQYVPRGPIAQWLEQSAHNCAHVSLHTMPTEVGGTEVNVSKAGSYLDGKPERDNSMTCKSLAKRPGSYAVYG